MKTISDHTIFCTSEQTKKAFELGAPLEVVTCHSSLEIDIAKKGKNRNEYTLVDNFQQPGEYWCKVITNPTAEQMIGFILGSGRGYAIDLAELIKECGYKQGCLTFIENSLK